MPLTKDQSAPYAPASAILEILNRNRSRGLPSPIDKEILARAGVSESLVPRTLQSMQILDLIDENGNHTETLEGLRLAPEAEYKGKLRQWLDAAYSDVLQFVDPEQDDEIKVRDAFRPFKPTGMQDRMVTLFTGLYTAAGAWSDRGPRPTASTPRPRPKSSPPRKPDAKAKSDVGPSDSATRNEKSQDFGPDLPAPIAGLLSGLPLDGNGWTKDRRDKFLVTFGAVLDFCFPISE